METWRPADVLFPDIGTPAEPRDVDVADTIGTTAPLRFDSGERRGDADGVHGRFSRPCKHDVEAAVVDASRPHGPDRHSAMILLSPSRSSVPGAPRALHDAGLARVGIPVEGFEGIRAPPDPGVGRHIIAGWKNDGLPWRSRPVTARSCVNFGPSRRAARYADRAYLTH